MSRPPRAEDHPNHYTDRHGCAWSKPGVLGHIRLWWLRLPHHRYVNALRSSGG